MKRVGPDLSLYPLFSQRRQRFVAPVELDDVRLPSVTVALGGAWRLDQTVEPLLVRLGERVPRLPKLVEAAELREPDRAEDVGQAVVEASFRNVEVATWGDSVVPHAPHGVRELLAPSRDRSAFAGGDDLARMERETRELAEPSARHPSPARAERAGSVLDQVHVRRHRVLELVPVERPPEQVHGEHGARPLCHRFVHLLGVEVHRPRIDVDEHRPRAGERDDVRRRREGVRRNEHFVAFADPEREHRQMKRRSPRGDGDRMLDPADPCELRLELGDLRPHRQLPALEHLRDRRRLLGADVWPR